MIKRLKYWWYITKAILRDDPVRTWRRLEDGRYACDGDCGRYSLHGVCTCGISHFFKFEEGRRSKVARDNESWHREGQTSEVMMSIPYENKCPHKLSWNLNCGQCRTELEAAMQAFMKEWNDTAR